MAMSYYPHFLSQRDPDHRDEREQRRDQYAQRGSEDRRDERHRESMEDFLESANHVARMVLHG